MSGTYSEATNWTGASYNSNLGYIMVIHLYWNNVTWHLAQMIQVAPHGAGNTQVGLFNASLNEIMLAGSAISSTINMPMTIHIAKLNSNGYITSVYNFNEINISGVTYKYMFPTVINYIGNSWIYLYYSNQFGTHWNPDQAVMYDFFTNQSYSINPIEFLGNYNVREINTTYSNGLGITGQGFLYGTISNYNVFTAIGIPINEYIGGNGTPGAITNGILTASYGSVPNGNIYYSNSSLTIPYTH